MVGVVVVETPVIWRMNDFTMKLTLEIAWSFALGICRNGLKILENMQLINHKFCCYNNRLICFRMFIGIINKLRSTISDCFYLFAILFYKTCRSYLVLWFVFACYAATDMSSFTFLSTKRYLHTYLMSLYWPTYSSIFLLTQLLPYLLTHPLFHLLNHLLIYLPT